MSLAETSLVISSEIATGPTGRYFVLSPCVSICDIKAVIAGHSHSAAISRALVARATTGVQLEARHIALGLGIGGLRGGPGMPAYWDILEDLARMPLYGMEINTMPTFCWHLVRLWISFLGAILLRPYFPGHGLWQRLPSESISARAWSLSGSF